MSQASGFTTKQLLNHREYIKDFIENAKKRASKSFIARDANLDEIDSAQKELDIINKELEKRLTLQYLLEDSKLEISSNIM